MRKRIISMILATSMLCTSLLTGCGEQQTSNKQETTKTSESVGKETATTTETQKEESSEPKELSVFSVGNNAYIENIDTNAFTLWYEDYSGVHVNWELPTGDAHEAFLLRVVGEDLPDVVYGIDFDTASRNTYGSDGIFIDLTDLIEEHAPNIKRMLEENPDWKEVLTAPDGAIYGIPKLNDSTIGRFQFVLWVYEPWLKALNIDKESIKTTEDLYNLFKLVVETDLNGNGKKDEIPFAARGMLTAAGILSYFMNSYTFCYTGKVAGDYLAMEDDEAVCVANTEAYREGLRYINKLYKEKLILNDSISMDRTTLTALGESEEPVLFASVGLWAPYFTTKNGQRSTEYVPLAPVVNEDGFACTVDGMGAVSGLTHMYITSACEDPVTAIKWLDGLWDEEPAAKAGITSVIPAEKGQIAINGEQALWTSPASVSAAEPNSIWNTFYVNWRDPEADFYTYYEDPVTQTVYTYRAEAQKIYAPFAMNKKVGAVALEGDEAAEYSELLTAIQNCITSNSASFITGEKSLDTDWDAYLKELEDYGIDRFMELVNKGIAK